MDIVIVAAARTAIGNFNGAFAAVPAHQLGEAAIRAALARAKLEPAAVDEVILGQVLTANQGQNPARQAARAAGVPDDKIAFGVNQVCGSGLRAVALAAQQIRTGESEIVVAGGQESMSQSQHAAHLRSGVKMGDLALVDTMIRDGLWDIFNGYHMGVTAENVAKAYQITRADQDALALASQHKTPEAIRHYQAALKTQPDFPEALNNLAWILAANPEAQVRDGRAAVALAERACQLTDYKQPMMVGTLAAAYAEAGRFAEAMTTAEKAKTLAEQTKQMEVAVKNRALLELYRSGQPARDTP